MRKTHCVLCVLTLLVWVGEVHADDGSSKRVGPTTRPPGARKAKKVGRLAVRSTQPKKRPGVPRLGNFRTLQAEFVQHQYYAFMRAPIRSSGRLYLSQKRMVWEILKPSHSRIVLVGERAYLFYPQMKVRRKLGAGRNQMMAAVARNLSMLCHADMKGLRRFYKIQKRGGLWQMTPKMAALRRVIARLRLRLSPQGFARWVEVKAPDGDRMEVRFTKVIINQKFPKHLLRF